MAGMNETVRLRFDWRFHEQTERGVLVVQNWTTAEAARRDVVSVN